MYKRWRNISSLRSLQHASLGRFADSNDVFHEDIQKEVQGDGPQWRYPHWYKDPRPFEHFRFTRQGPYRPKPSQYPLRGECIVSPSDIRVEKVVYGIWDMPGRTQALLFLLLTFSVFLSSFGVVSIFYPLITEHINLGVFHVPKVSNQFYFHELLRAAVVAGQWVLPIQCVYVLFGPGGVLLAAVVGMSYSAREMGMVHNIHYRFRTENPFNYSTAVFIFVLSGRALAMAGQWIIQKLSPPCCCNLLGLVTCVVPHFLCIYLTSGVYFHVEKTITEIMMPIAFISSSVMLTIAIVCVTLIFELKQCLPSNGIFRGSLQHVGKPLQYWCQFLLHPVIWIHIWIHMVFFAFNLFWISSIPSAHTALKWSGSIASCYQKLLILDGIGRFVVPFLADGLFGPRFTRLDALVLLGVPLLFLNIVGALGYLTSRVTSYWLYCTVGCFALMAPYAISVTRATVDCFFTTSLFSIAQTLAVIGVLMLNHGTYFVNFVRILQMVQILICCGICAHFILWFQYCDFLADDWGYPHGVILGQTKHHPCVSQLYIPTALIPIFVHQRPEQEKNQLNYYLWNHHRLTPIEIEKKNAAHDAAERFRKEQEGELMCEVRERIVF